MQKVVVEIAGMTCEHCVRSVTEELTAVGAHGVIVDLVKGGVSTAQFDTPQPIAASAIEGAITEAGYQVHGIDFQG